MISVKNVTKKFDDFTALDDLSIEIESGSAYGLLGSNGAGKSTLLRLLAGIYRQDSGTLLIDGQPIYDNPSVKQRIYYVGDDTQQYSDMTPDEIRDMCKVFYPNFSEEKYEKLISAIGLPRNKKMSKFSKGMKRQASVICGLASNTEILLLDEAFDGLDPTMRITVRKMLIESMADSNATVIISSHNLGEIEQLCDAVGLIHKGKVVFDRELDCIKESIHKIQASFDKPVGADDLDGAEILDIKTIGSVQTFIAKGDAEQIKALMIEKGTKFCDIIPLTLDEIFIYEMEGQGYDSTDIDR